MVLVVWLLLSLVVSGLYVVGLCFRYGYWICFLFEKSVLLIIVVVVRVSWSEWWVRL